MAKGIESRGGKLWFIEGKSVEAIPRLARALGVDRVLAMRWSEPFGRERDDRVAADLHCPLELLEGETLLQPGTLRSQAGRPYTVFTPFNKSFRKQIRVGPERFPPEAFRPLGSLPEGWDAVPMPTMESVGLKGNPNLLRGGEEQANERLEAFVNGPGARYAELRNRMDAAGMSRLSADIKFGVISP
jgi:deoxyribodipyrimidine photo-lyase